MAKKRAETRATRAEAARKEAERIATEVGKQQAAHRKALRELEAATPQIKKSRYFDLGPTTLFEGGRKENSLSEDADDAFTAEDLMLNRRAVTDKESGLVLHKKGQVKFRGWAHGLKEANEQKLAPYRGKRILLVTHFEKNKHGVTTRHTVQREITYTDYNALVAEYRDAFRAETFDVDSDAAYGVTSVEFSPPAERTQKRKRKKKAAKKNKGKARKKTAKAAVGSAKRPARKRGRRMGTKRKKSAKRRKP